MISWSFVRYLCSSVDQCAPVRGLCLGYSWCKDKSDVDRVNKGNCNLD